MSTFYATTKTVTKSGGQRAGGETVAKPSLNPTVGGLAAKQ